MAVDRGVGYVGCGTISGEINSDLVKNLTIQIFLMSNNGIKRLIYFYKSLPVLSFTTNDAELKIRTFSSTQITLKAFY